jgi:hypothetical protein
MNMVNCLKKIADMQCAGCPLRETCRQRKDIPQGGTLYSTRTHSMQKKENKRI